MDDANDYVALHAVLIHGGFSAAARRVGLPKATLSKRVARLEERLGVRLLERSTRNVRPTEVGRQIFEQAQAIVAGLGAAAAVAASAQAEPNGVLRVGSPQGLIHGMLAEILPDFLRLHPRICLHLEEMNRPADLVRDRIDVALRARYEVEAGAHLVVRQFCREAGVLAAAPAYLAELGTLPLLQDIPRLPTLAMAHETIWNLVDRSGECRQIEVAPRLLSTNVELLRMATEAGLGIALLPQHVCRPGFQSGTLVRILPELATAEGTIYADFSSRRGLTPAIRALIDYLAETIPRTTSPV
ncbi:LysR family transcriptional regulator [Aurantimonas sp. 22II-16-19i]|uniref:LysR family transcriptional regulator n=1 Tax=Aurantimonas sp. 22II-16-19i TaxID=1317114 RepID=UPI0009F7B1CA|nr:LysR family transcriptional regulator [Aurantimonas sp. 22II-16-19i]ORE90349.1 transcriptional regulator [Aurantimonas sp. 22II-16-19i]